MQAHLHTQPHSSEPFADHSDDVVAWAAFMGVITATFTLAALIEGASAAALLVVGISLASRAFHRLSPKR